MSVELEPQVTENGHEQEEPEVLASLELLMAEVAKKRDRPPIKYRDAETGMTFHLRELTGEDIEAISSIAGQDEKKYMRMLAERASAKPKIDMLMWEAIGKLGPMVRGGLVLKIRQISGMLDENIEQVKNS